MFFVLAALPLAIAATAFGIFFFLIGAGITLAAMAVQFFLVRYKSKRAGLVLPVVALCVCTLSALGSLLMVYLTDRDPLLLIEYLPALITGNIPAGLLFLERHLILKWMRKKGLYTR